jgi:sensor c-di-GMP phosphodiesterase-like protein
MSVIAEGIEAEDQVKALIACGVEEGQGYLVAAPLPLPKFIALLEARHAAAGDAMSDAALVA